MKRVSVRIFAITIYRSKLQLLILFSAQQSSQKIKKNHGRMDRKCVTSLILNTCKKYSSYDNPFSVAGPDPGSGAFLNLDQGFGIVFFWIPDPKHICDSLMTNFWVKSIIILTGSVLAKKNYFTC
jgi:hypothetical protein